MAKRSWVYVGAATGAKPKPDEKRAITQACEKLIAEVILPRSLPKIEPTEFNYPVGIHGKWYGNKYRFMIRYRSGFKDNAGEEFDIPFVRLEYVGRHFDVSWHRHTGEWCLVQTHLSLEEALALIGDGTFGPHV